MEYRTITDQVYDEERAFYNSDHISVRNCRFDGPADGESAFKESCDIEVEDCYFNLRYPFWHDERLRIRDSELTGNCRAALWYSRDVEITGSKLFGIKAFRECEHIRIANCTVQSPEFGWSVHDLSMKDSSVESEYFMMRSDGLSFNNVVVKGKYSFQYIADSVLENCNFDTKDALWHARNVVVKNSTINGEYLAWYCENVVFENCRIIGTQPLCYCKGLKLIDCEMIDADLAFEKSEVEAVITTPVISIKNPLSGTIRVPKVGEIIMDDAHAAGEILIAKEDAR